MKNYNNVGEVYDSYEDDQVKYVCPICYIQHNYATKYCSIDCFKKDIDKEKFKEQKCQFDKKQQCPNKDGV
jgi:hypothetical protein|tara:strand:- start:35 stop:247 length:213 start_codon:yes stop_codon:yes gene_type:complete